MEQREAERRAFARAKGYLSYHAGAKWSALLAALGTGLLFVVLLLVLWLFGDLMVHRGLIPGFHELSPSKQKIVLEEWQSSEGGIARLVLMDLKSLEKPDQRVQDLVQADPAKLTPRDEELLWRFRLYELLRRKVNGAAAALVLPTYRELPETEKQAFQAWWNTSPNKKKWLEDDELGLNEQIFDTLAQGDAEQQRSGLDMAWRTYLYGFFRYRLETPHYDTWNALAKRLREDGQRGYAVVEENPLADRGILSLIVRSHFQSGILSSVAGRITMSWMYKNFIIYLIGLFVVAAIVLGCRTALTVVQHEMAARAAIAASTRLRRAVYHHTFRLGALAIKELGPTEAVTIYTRHVEAVHDGLYTWLTVYYREPFKFCLLLLFALVVHPWLALAFLMFAMLSWLVAGYVAAYYARQGKAATNRAAEQLTLIRESLMLMRLVKVYLMELFNQSRVERLLARYAALQMRRYRGEAIYKPSLYFLGSLFVLLLLFVTGLIVLNDQLGVAGAITLALALISLYWPLVAMLENRKNLRRAREASVVLFRFLDRPSEVGQALSAEFLQPLSQRLEFDNVSLRDPGSKNMLIQDISLTVQAGQRVALVGAEDREKHALVYLMPRFLDPTTGEIRIDDKNLKGVTLDSLRAQIAMVMQHNLVFHDSVANNISCGDSAYTMPQIIEAAKIAHAHHFIQKLPQGYETPIGELGHPLNVSEQFRIGLARAILRDPALLIIEEPATDIDEDTKSLLDDTFTRVLPGRTVIFLPHRISTIRSCDQIFLLHKGRLEASGVHRELLTQNPLYRHLHYIEFAEVAESV